MKIHEVWLGEFILGFGPTKDEAETMARTEYDAVRGSEDDDFDELPLERRTTKAVNDRYA